MDDQGHSEVVVILYIKEWGETNDHNQFCAPVYSSISLINPQAQTLSANRMLVSLLCRPIFPGKMMTWLWTRVHASTSSKDDKVGGTVCTGGSQTYYFLRYRSRTPLAPSSMIEASDLVWLTNSSNHVLAILRHPTLTLRKLEPDPPLI